MIEKNDLISRYFHLEESINRSLERIRWIKKIMYTTSFHTHMEPGDNGDIVVKAFKLDHEVINFVDCSANIKRHIDMDTKRMNYFTRFLDTLKEEEYTYLQDRYVKDGYISYNRAVERHVIDEINEIEEAIMHMYGYQPDLREILPDDSNNMGIKDILSVLGL